MNRDILRLGAIAAVLLLGLGVAIYLYRQSQQEEQRAQARAAVESSRLVRDHSHVQGRPDAPVTVVEFLDPECEACRAMYPLVKRIQAEFGDRMRLVIRYMPLHPNSEYAAGALEAAAAQGRFWEFLELLFANQPVWGNHHDPRPELIPQLAEQMGLNMAKFEHFLARGSYRERVEIDRADGEALGVRGTPTFFVNGRQLEQLGYDSLRDLIRQELESGVESSS